MRERRLWMVKTDVEFATLYAAVLLKLRNPNLADFELSWRQTMAPPPQSAPPPPADAAADAPPPPADAPPPPADAPPPPEAATASRDEDEPMADDDIDNARDVANYTALEAGADPPGAG